MDSREIGYEDVDGVLLAQDDQWRALVSTEVNLHERRSVSELAERLVPPQERV
jgi:hypothetical protein